MFGLGPLEMLLIGVACIAPLVVSAALAVFFMRRAAVNPHLTHCPDCGRRVSRLAAHCPRCGKLLPSE